MIRCEKARSLARPHNFKYTIKTKPNIILLYAYLVLLSTLVLAQVVPVRSRIRLHSAANQFYKRHGALQL